MFENVKHIICDLDGTLIDSSEGVVAATNYALESLGEPPRTAEEIKPFIGYPLETMFATFCKAPIDRLKAAFQEKACHSIVASTRPLPGADEVIRVLHDRGYRLGIATTKFSIHTEGIVKKCGWERYFAALASGDEVARVKPAPDIIQLALQRMGGEVADSVMVGDTINDILAAHCIGLKVIAIASPFGENDLRAHGPDMFLESFSELKSVFNLKSS